MEPTTVQAERERCLRVLALAETSFEYFDKLLKQSGAGTFPLPGDLLCRIGNQIRSGEEPLSFDEQWED